MVPRLSLPAITSCPFVMVMINISFFPFSSPPSIIFFLARRSIASLFPKVPITMGKSCLPVTFSKSFFRFSTAMRTPFQSLGSQLMLPFMLVRHTASAEGWKLTNWSAALQGRDEQIVHKHKKSSFFIQSKIYLAAKLPHSTQSSLSSHSHYLYLRNKCSHLLHSLVPMLQNKDECCIYIFHSFV